MAARGRLRLAATAAAVVLAACGSSHEPEPSRDGGMDAGTSGDDAGRDAASDVRDEPDAGPPPSPAETYLRERARLLCQYGVRCEPRRWAGADDALDLYCHPARVDRLMARWLDPVEAGHLRFDADAAEACLAVLREQVSACGFGGADEWRERLASCGPVFRGARPVGEPCTSRPDTCEPGASCQFPSPDASEGTCVAVVGEGEACGSGVAECRRDFDVGVYLRCEEGRCAPPPERGEPCTFDTDCAIRDYCYEDVCTAPRGEGEACDGYRGPLPGCDAEAGLRCVDGVCGPGRAEDEPCDVGECAEELTCIGDPARCVPEAGAAAGQACYEWDFVLGSSCASGLVCHVEHVFDSFVAWGTCVEGAAPREPCDAATACELGARCIDGRCVRTVLPDGTCGPEAVCPRTHACDDGRCRPLPEPGEICHPTTGCYRGRCEDGVCCIVRDFGECDPDEEGVVLDACGTACLGTQCVTRTDHCAESCSGRACWREPDRCVPLCS